MSSLRAIVSSTTSLPEELPLIHTSLCKDLDSIVTSGTIETRNCSVFGESLAYFFYGRPAYRSERGAQYGEPIPLCPVCFVFKPQSVAKSVHRLYPCDSGAVSKGKFAPQIVAGDLSDLSLEPCIESARRAVGLLFETNGNYFLGKVTPGKTFDPNSTADRFYRLLHDSGPVRYDDRKSAIEISVKASVALTDHLLFVVLPREYLSVPAIREAIINCWNCDPVPYDTFNGDKPESYYGVVRNEVTKRFRGENRI